MHRKICGVKSLKYSDRCVCDNILRRMECFVLNNSIRFSPSDCVADFVVGNIDMVTMKKKNISNSPGENIQLFKVYKVTFWSTYFGQTLFFTHLLLLDMFWKYMHFFLQLTYEMHIKVLVNNEFMFPF